VKNLFSQYPFLKFTFSFLFLFAFFYYAFQFVAGLAVPGGYYSAFVEQYFNIASWLRSSLIISTKNFVALFGYNAIRIDDYVLRIVNGRGIRIVFQCLGVAVLCFWLAYVIANNATIKKKMGWLFGGVFLIWAINVVRISLVLITGNNGMNFPFGIDHHTWFNIVAYAAIFLMMFFFEKSIKSKISK
jgi:exosortase/archaeosortase family protein